MNILLEAEKLTKRYPGTLALDEVSFDLRPGEVHCLIGENGAGKSTLIKILSGAISQDSGKVLLEGTDVSHMPVRERAERGISVIYQDLNLVPQLTVAENIFLGHEPRTSLGTIDTRSMKQLSEKLIEMLGVPFSIQSKVGDLTIPLQQLTATARALSLNGKVLIMDEPSTVLSGKDLQVLFDVVRRLQAQGIGIIYISHHIEEVFILGNRVTVLRDGHFVATKDVADTSKDELIRMMVGRSITDLNKPLGGRTVGEEVLRVEHLSRRRYFEDISFTLHAGEVLGIAGLVGAGRTEVIRAVVGLDRFDSGSIHLHGRPQVIHSPGHAVSLGIALVPEDRKAEGIISVLSVRSNATLSVLRSMSTFGFLHFAKLKSKIDELARILAIKAPRLGAPVSGLSGGNQQKVVLAKCLATDCRILILDEPTRGVDIGTKFDIYRQIDELVRSGMAVILISSELPEVLTLSDRILVMSEGWVAAELDGRTATQEEIMHNAVPRAEAGTTARAVQ